jgi:hypothetical protein
MSIIVCIAVGSGGVSYAFFASFLLMIAGVFALAEQRRFRPSLLGELMEALQLAGFHGIYLDCYGYPDQPLANRLAPDRRRFPIPAESRGYRTGDWP